MIYHSPKIQYNIKYIYYMYLIDMDNMLYDYYFLSVQINLEFNSKKSQNHPK